MDSREILKARLQLMSEILYENHLLVDKKKLMDEMQRVAFKLRSLE